MMFYKKFKFFFIMVLSLVFQLNCNGTYGYSNNDLVRGNTAAFKEVNYSFIDNCFKKVDLNARRVFIDEKHKMIFIENPEIIFFFESGSVFFISARYGIFCTDSNYLGFFGDIFGHNDDYRIETNYMNYSYDLSFLKSGKSVILGKKGFSIRVNEVVIDLEKNEFKWSNTKR